MTTEIEFRHGGGRSASVAPMPITPRDLRVPTSTPVVMHRHGPGRYSVAVVVEGPNGELTEEQAREALAKWRALLGGWVTKRDAASMLGISVKMVDVLRRNGRLDAENVNGQVRVSLKSVKDERQRRKASAAPADTAKG